MTTPSIPTIDPKERALAAVYRRLYQKGKEAEAKGCQDQEKKRQNETAHKKHTARRELTAEQLSTKEVHHDKDRC